MPLVLGASLYKFLDGVVGKCARIALLGKARLDNDDSRVHALTNGEVLRRWGLPPLELELAVRRLRWYPAWARTPQRLYH